MAETQTQTINKLIISIGGTDYELDGGGGGGLTPGVPIPNDTVDSDSIINGSVEMEDLNDSVKEKIQKTYVEDDESLHMDYDVQQQEG